MSQNIIKEAISHLPNIINKSNIITNKERLFAIIQMFGKQHIVKSGDLLMVNGHIPVKVGQPIIINKCIVLGGKDFSIIGRPIVDKELFRIDATAVEQTMSDVKCSFRHTQRCQGHKKYFFQSLPRTTIRINNIHLKELPQEGEMELICED